MDKPTHDWRSRGYIKLWRVSDDHPLYRSEPFTKWQAWVDLLLLANHTPRDVAIRGILVHVERGQVLAGEEFLAKRWRWSRGKVRRFLSYLSSKTVQQIVQQKNNVCSVFSIRNWNVYQPDDTANGTADSTTDGQQTDIPKNVENVKNEKKKNPPTPQRGKARENQKVKENSPLMDRIGGWFNRRPATLWTHAEANALSLAEPADEDVALLEWFFGQRGKDGVWLRQNVITLLNNWQGEVDKANAFKDSSKPEHRGTYEDIPIKRISFK